MLAGAGALVIWNASRFLDLRFWNANRFQVAKPEIRAKDLDFLPAPETARVLALGHTNTLAKLRWIDSFAYFQYQLDRKDDRVAGGGSGFERLYRTLIQLDPQFEPFYEHAALNLSGVLNNHVAALGFLMLGNQEIPQSSGLWRNTIATLKVFFKLDERRPIQFDAMLAAWEEAERDPGAKRMVWDWKRKFGSDTFSGLEQLPYWLAQLDRVVPGTPNGDYVEATTRQLLARFGERELNALVASWRIVRGGVPRDRRELVENLTLINPLRPTVEDDVQPASLQDLLDPVLVRRRYPDGLPAFGPLMVSNGRLGLRTDPYGCPWKLRAGRVVSSGQEQASFKEKLGRVSVALLDLAQQQGRWPATLDEATAMGLSIPAPPEGGTVRLDGRQVVVDWAVEAGPPWPLREVPP